MLSVEQILNNYSYENDIVIGLYTKEQFDEFMSILENENWKWRDGQMPTENYKEIGYSLKNFLLSKELGIIMINLHSKSHILSYDLLCSGSFVETYQAYFEYPNQRIIVPYAVMRNQIVGD